MQQLYCLYICSMLLHTDWCNSYTVYISATCYTYRLMQQLYCLYVCSMLVHTDWCNSYTVYMYAACQYIQTDATVILSICMQHVSTYRLMQQLYCLYVCSMLVHTDWCNSYTVYMYAACQYIQTDATVILSIYMQYLSTYTLMQQLYCLYICSILVHKDWCNSQQIYIQTDATVILSICMQHVST